MKTKTLCEKPEVALKCFTSTGQKLPNLNPKTKMETRSRMKSLLLSKEAGADGDEAASEEAEVVLPNPDFSKKSKNMLSEDIPRFRYLI